MENKLIWLDLEMTGLDPNSERIIEIFTAVTDENLTEILDQMDEWNQEHHKKSGLIDEVKRSVITQEDAEAMTLDFLSQHVGKNVSPLCGNTVWHDRKFLTLYMPQLEDYFHYRVIDVSSVKELTKRWRPDATKPKSKEIAHRARPDVFESIEELRFYRDHIFAQ